MKPWITYTLIRLGIFAAVFGLLYGVVNLDAWLAALIAAIVGLCVSYIFFRPQRDRAIDAVTSAAAPGSDERAED